MHINFGNRKFFNHYGININALQKAINHVYMFDIKKPIFIKFINRLKNFAGKHSFRYYSDKHCKFMSEAFKQAIKDTNVLNNSKKVGTHFHQVTMGGTKIFGNVFDNYTQKKFFHTLAHEIQHAIQYDNQKNFKLTYQFSDYSMFNDLYYHTPIEADAEYGAMMNTMYLMNAYFKFLDKEI